MSKIRKTFQPKLKVKDMVNFYKNSHKYHYSYLGLDINSDVKEKIEKLSKEYWNYKGFFKFPPYKYTGFYIQSKTQLTYFLL